MVVIDTGSMREFEAEIGVGRRIEQTKCCRAIEADKVVE